MKSFYLSHILNPDYAVIIVFKTTPFHYVLVLIFNRYFYIFVIVPIIKMCLGTTYIHTHTKKYIHI